MFEASGSDHFYLTLPSNSSYNIYGKQSPANYRTQLPRELVLDPEEWEVGLSEIFYTRTWYNAPDAILYVHQSEIRARSSEGISQLYVPAPPLSCALPLMKYTSPEHLVGVWNDCILKESDSGVRLSVDPETKQAIVRLSKGLKLEMNAHASLLLGFGDYTKTVIHEAGVEHPSRREPRHLNHVPARIARSPLPVGMNRIVNTLYVYSDVASPQLVGDAHVPLVRAVVDRADIPGETVSRSFTNVHYVNISRSVIRDVQVYITGDTGRDIPFDGGRVTVKLHFRKKQR